MTGADSKRKTAASIKTELERPGTTQEDNQLIAEFQERLPANIISLPCNEDFKSKMNIHWAQQAREHVPRCIISPKNAEQLSEAIKLLSKEYFNRQSSTKHVGLFAIRSGGYGASPNASSIKGGILVDLSAINSVTISKKRDEVEVGTGANWAQVNETLDSAGLAIPGGRNGGVGVGGLTLGGGISFFSPRHGFVCSGVVSYEVVLADGKIVLASETSHPDLWKALKGGLNNFGVVTKFTFKSFPRSDLWSGWIIMLPFQSHKTMAAFQEYVESVKDADAAGPILVYGWFYPLGIKLTTCNLTYTKAPDQPNRWPDCFARSGFKSLWHYDTCKTQTLTSICKELSRESPPGKRELFGTVTFQNSLNTMKEAHRIVEEATSDLPRFKKWRWFLIFQPILLGIMPKGQQNCLGLSDEEKTLICLSFTITWEDSALDERLDRASKNAIEQIEVMADKHQTLHKYKYANYCATWQNPFNGYGDGDMAFLRKVNKAYDREGFFQYACPGGPKIWDSRASF